MPADVLPLSLMALWVRHKRECRTAGSIVEQARAGKLPGVQQFGFSFVVSDQQAALTAMRKAD